MDASVLRRQSIYDAWKQRDNATFSFSSTFYEKYRYQVRFIVFIREKYTILKFVCHKFDELNRAMKVKYVRVVVGKIFELREVGDFYPMT